MTEETNRDQCDSCKQWFEYPKAMPIKERPIRHRMLYSFCNACERKNYELAKAQAKPVESAYCDNDWEGLQGPDFGTVWDRGLYRGK